MRISFAEAITKDRFLIVVIILLVIPYVISHPWFLRIATLTSMWAVLALSWNILGGFTGQISFGHAAFFGLGAYTSTLLFLYYNISPWIGLFIGAGVATVASFLIGYLTFRLRGHYFALSMLAFPLILLLIFSYHPLEWYELRFPFLGDAPLYFQFASRHSYYQISLMLLAITVYVVRMLDRSRIALYWRAIKENEDAAESLGVNTFKYKMIALMISAFIAGVVGTFYVQYVLTVDPHIAFGLHVSVNAVVMPIVGGLGTIWGPILGAVLLVPFGEITTALWGGSLPGLHMIIYGIILIIVIAMIPEGLYPRIRKVVSFR
jgi:ABC-type branched-subunit amino acid transport system permease subunit